MKIAWTSALLVVLFSTVRGQQASRVLPADTVRTMHVVLVDPGISLARSTLVLPPSLARDILPEEMFFEFPVRQSSLRAPLFESPAAVPIDIMRPLRLQMASERKLETLRTILATVQIGGVAYLAYEHIKKHGLFK